MARGFLSGLVIGGAISVVGAGILAVVAFPPLQPPQPPADSAPAQTAAPQVSDSPAPVVAAPSAAPQAVPQMQAAAPVDAAQTDAPERPEPPSRTQTDAATEIAVPQAPMETAMPAEARATVPNPAPAVPPVAIAGADGVAQMPQVETSPPVQTNVAIGAAPQRLETPQTQAALVPVPLPRAQEPTPPAAVAPRAVPVPVPVPQAPTSPDVATQPAEPRAPANVASAPIPRLPERTLPVVGGPVPQANQTVQSGLPRIGQPATSLIERPTSESGAVEAKGEQTPLQLYAVPFDAAETRPLMGIVLMDQGESMVGSGIGIAALSSFPYPLSFAVDVNLPDAKERMATYRAQGFEVLALVDLPESMTGSETEISLTASLAAIPEAVAVLEGPGTGLQGGRDMSDQVSAIMAATGHGIVWRPKGLDTAQKLAARQGVASQTLFRDFDSAGQTPTVIRRFLDQAALKAGQQGTAIMVGRVRPDTISALLLWGLQDRANRVAVAPISAVLLAAQEDS